MINARQCLKARALLGWTKVHLAENSGVFAQTINRLEAGYRVRPPLQTAIRAAFEAAGVQFTNGDAPGVRLRAKQTIQAVPRRS